MASAIFVVEFPPEINLPPMADPDDGSTHLSHAYGHGFSVVGMVPQAPTCLVRVWSDAATIAAMDTDAAYELVEMLEE